MVTILDALTAPNVRVNAEAVVPGGNTELETSIEAGTWLPWEGFDYATLTRIFRRQLRQEYDGSPEPRPLRKDRAISNEETLDDLLRRFVSPVVNYALEKQAGSPHYGRGSRCPDLDFKPDWSVVSDSRLSGYGGYVNLLPGVTKLSAKWWPAMVDSGNPSDMREWQKVMAQILTYMAYHQSRYGFVVTDKVLVALRLTRCPLDRGLAADRPRRPPGATHQRLPSDTSMASAASSSYLDDDPLQWDYYSPEYAVVDWAAHGPGQLTVKLTLWCLAMMATNGDSYIDYQYPALDSWRRGRGGYVHNTSGATKARLSGDDTYQEPSAVEPLHVAGPAEGAASTSYSASASSSYHHYPAVAGPGTSTSVGPEDADEPVFSQAGTPYLGDEIVVAVDEYEAGHHGGGGGDDEDKGGDTGGEEDQDETEEGGEVEVEVEDEDEDSRTEVGRSVARVTVTVKKHRVSRSLYFVDARGSQRATSKSEWRKVPGGYELGGRRHVYFYQALSLGYSVQSRVHVSLSPCQACSDHFSHPRLSCDTESALGYVVGHWLHRLQLVRTSSSNDS